MRLIDGLSVKQIKLLEVMWNMDSMDDVDRFIDTFGPRRQKECRSLIEIAKLAELDELSIIEEETNKVLFGIMYNIRDY